MARKCKSVCTEDDKEKYQRYLCSREWAEKREAVRERSGGRCERCTVLPMEACHHLTYVRKYHEHLDDLQAICNACHNFTHGKSDFDPTMYKKWLYFLSRCGSDVVITKDETEAALKVIKEFPACLFMGPFSMASAAMMRAWSRYSLAASQLSGVFWASRQLGRDTNLENQAWETFGLGLTAPITQDHFFYEWFFRCCPSPPSSTEGWYDYWVSGKING